jgi:hypothetical protein
MTLTKSFRCLSTIGKIALGLQFSSIAYAQTTIPVRQLKSIVSSDSTVLMGLTGARHLPNGSVLVNDPTKRQLVLFDSTLTHHKVLADTSTSSPYSYGLTPSTGGLIPYVADSTLFIDQTSFAFLVIDPKGSIVRVMAPVRATDLRYISAAPFATSGFDAKGRLLYKTERRPANSNLFMSGPIVPGVTSITARPDSAPIMRMDLDRRSVDTLGFLKIPTAKSGMVTISNGMASFPVINPLPSGDEWTLLPDGTVAIVRAQDYHIDWLGADGKIKSTPKMPFDWKRITPEEKQLLVDSVKKAEADRIAKIPAPPPGGFAFPRPIMVLEPNELPDFYPPVRQGQVRADPDGNVWILPSTSTAAAGGGLLYDVVNREGAIVERVQLPKGRTLVGFGPNGTIYMHNVRSPVLASIERAQVAR